LDLSARENALSNEFAEEELKTIVHYIEQHIHWAKSDHNDGLARLHMVIAESLIEFANLVRTQCKSLSEKYTVPHHKGDLLMKDNITPWKAILILS